MIYLMKVPEVLTMSPESYNHQKILIKEQLLLTLDKFGLRKEVMILVMDKCLLTECL